MVGATGSLPASAERHGRAGRPWRRSAGSVSLGFNVNATLILNPYANRWNARKKRAGALSALQAAGVECAVVETTAPNEAAQAAAAAAMSGADAVVALGGDGTVSEAVNGLLSAAGDRPTIPFGVMPAGTGNDFSDMAGLPRDFDQAAAVIATGRTRQIDVGRITYARADGTSVACYFDNNCAAAMEPMVTIENTRIRRPAGNARYVVSLFQALRKLKIWDMRVEWDDGRYEGPVHLLSVCNSPRCGGLFTMAPGAVMDDGLFDFVLAKSLSKFEILRLLPRFFRGTHVRHPKVRLVRTRRVTVTCDPPTPIHADGEVLTESAVRIEFEILPGRLSLLS